jgi:outer membrane protein, heavy metal efflux system
MFLSAACSHAAVFPCFLCIARIVGLSMKKEVLVKVVAALGGVLVIGLGGCATQPVEESWEEPRPLGKELRVYRPPREGTNAALAAARLEEPTGALTLRQALALSLERSPELASFSWDVRIGEARMLQASLRPNPEVGVEEENVLGTGDYRGFRLSQTTIELSQIIELGGKRAARMKEAALSRDLAGWDYETRRIEVLTRTAGTFVEVLSLQQRLALAEETVRLAEDVAQAVGKRVEAAKTFTVEKTKADVALASAQVERDQTQRALAAARQRLAAKWGTTQPKFEWVEGNLEEMAPVPPQERLLGRLRQNPELARWATEVAQRQATVRVERSKAVPDITVGGGYRRLPDLAGESGPNDNALLFSVSVPLPLFNKNQGAIKEAEYRVAKATEEQRATDLRLRTELGQSWQRLAAAAAEIEALKSKVLPGARQTFDTMSQYYRDGRLSYLEVLDAQRTLFSGRAQYLRALSDYHVAVNDLEGLLGEPLSSQSNKP